MKLTVGVFVYVAFVIDALQPDGAITRSVPANLDFVGEEPAAESRSSR